MFLKNYSSILIFLTASLILSLVIFTLSFLVSQKADDREKLTAYECGFNPFEDSKSEFDVRFYLVAILFLIFDLEISFLFPFVVSFSTINSVGLYSMLTFLFVLTIDFYFLLFSRFFPFDFYFQKY